MNAQVAIAPTTIDALIAVDADTLFTVCTVAGLDGTPVRYIVAAKAERIPSRLVHRGMAWRVMVETFYVADARNYFGRDTFPAGSKAGFDQCAGMFKTQREARAFIGAELARLS